MEICPLVLFDEEKYMTPPITIYLIGFAGSRKYTIAKEIANYRYEVSR